MGTSTKNARLHPLYAAMLPVWTLMRDAESSTIIKSKKDVYLPPTSGMLADGYSRTSSDSLGSKVYNSYLTRAYYPDVFEEAVETAVGIMHRKPPNIKLTPKLEILRDSATDGGETLNLLLRRINADQLTTGRLGLMGDIRVTPEGLEEPVLLVYNEMNAFNWDDTRTSRADANLRFVSLDESSYELGVDLDWDYKEKTRLLALVTPDGRFAQYEPGTGRLPSNVVYGFVELDEHTAADFKLNELQFTVINVKGNTTQKIPFTFINSRDLLSTPDSPPLKGLVDIALTIYRGEADYRQNLFMQGQDTLVKIGEVGGDDDEDTTRTGVGACISLGVNGDAKYIGVNSQGLPEQRQALEADYKRAERKTSKLTSNSNTQESGDALRIRAASQTATLPQVALSGAAGLQKVLRQLAELLGDNPDEVVVSPNMEFTDGGGNPVDLKSIMEAKLLGAPISLESIHGWAKRSGFTDFTLDEELDALELDDDIDVSFSTGNEDEASANVGTNVDVDNPDDTGTVE